jgi:hypothetical protein
MLRYIAAFGFLSLIALPPAFAQNIGKETPSKEAQTKNDRAKESPAKDQKLEDALLDIRLLKQLVDEQSRRIAELEKTVKALQAAAEPEPPSPDRARPVTRPPASPWLIPSFWAQVRTNMSRSDVEGILGSPTSVDSVIDHQTLYYRGNAPDGSAISGSVQLTDDRVTEVNPPDF